MRAAFSMVSLLVVVAVIAYLYTSQPALQPTDLGNGGYQRLQQKAQTAAEQLKGRDAQADVDAALNPPTNAPAPSPGN